MIRSHLARPFSFDRRANTALINIAQPCGINRCLAFFFQQHDNILTISIWLDQPAESSGSGSQNKSFLACANKFVGKQKHENWCWQGWEEGHTHTCSPLISIILHKKGKLQHIKVWWCRSRNNFLISDLCHGKWSNLFSVLDKASNL